MHHRFHAPAPPSSLPCVSSLYSFEIPKMSSLLLLLGLPRYTSAVHAEKNEWMHFCVAMPVPSQLNSLALRWSSQYFVVLVGSFVRAGWMASSWPGRSSSALKKIKWSRMHLHSIHTPLLRIFALSLSPGASSPCPSPLLPSPPPCLEQQHAMNQRP